MANASLVQKGLTDQYLSPVIPSFCEKFVHYLSVPNGPTSDSGLKTDIIKAINCLITKLPKNVSNFLSEMLHPIWETLVHSAKTYQEETISGEILNDREIDSDGECF